MTGSAFYGKGNQSKTSDASAVKQLAPHPDQETFDRTEAANNPVIKPAVADIKLAEAADAAAKKKKQAEAQKDNSAAGKFFGGIRKGVNAIKKATGTGDTKYKDVALPDVRS